MKHFLGILSLTIYTGLAFGELADVPTSEIEQAPPLVQTADRGEPDASSALVVEVARSALAEISAKTQRSSDQPAELSTLATFCRDHAC